MVTTTRRQETREQAILRLAERARESGVQLLQDSRGRWWASSVSQPGHTHAVTAVSCDCKGFTHHGRCIHHSLLLVHLGWVTDESEPTTWSVSSEPTLSNLDSEPSTCQWCHGQGSEPSTELFSGRRVDIRVTCWHCRGTGQLAA